MSFGDTDIDRVPDAETFRAFFFVGYRATGNGPEENFRVPDEKNPVKSAGMP